MASRANWAKMTVSSGGTGTLTLTAVSGFPTFTQAFGAGTTTVAYVISGTNLREAGTATYDGTALTLADRVVTQTWNGTTYGTAALNIPTSSVEVYCDFIAQTTMTTDGAVELPGTLIEDDTITVDKLQSSTLLDNTDLQDALGVPNTSGKQVEILFSLYDIANGTYKLDPLASWPYTINSLVIESLDNTATVAVRIDGVDVTGLSSVSVTTTQSTTAGTAGNSVVAGDIVTLVVSAISSTASLVGKLRVTRG